MISKDCGEYLGVKIEKNHCLRIRRPQRENLLCKYDVKKHDQSRYNSSIIRKYTTEGVVESPETDKSKLSGCGLFLVLGMMAVTLRFRVVM